MTAYGTTDIQHKLVNENAEEAFNCGLIDEAAFTAIKAAHPVTLYTPNYFIRIGLGALTAVACIFSAFLFWMLFGVNSTGGITALLFFTAVACYITLELFVKGKKYYNAGIDNILMVSAVAFLFAGCTMQDDNNTNIMSTGLCFIACLWLCYRFADAFAGMLAYVFFFLFIYFDFTFFTAAQSAAPLLMMAVSAAVYFALKKLHTQQQWLHYAYCADCIILLSVVSFYLSGNYYIIRQGAGSMFFSGVQETVAPPAFGWFFWIITICTPLAYLVYGITGRSLLFIRTGILALAASVLTVRYYHTVIPADIALMLAGVILIATSYLLIKYLRMQKHGYVFDASAGKDTADAEALVIAQAFGHIHHAVPEHNVEFGGGSSGGGGATGTF